MGEERNSGSIILCGVVNHTGGATRWLRYFCEDVPTSHEPSPGVVEAQAQILAHMLNKKANPTFRDALKRALR
jgi:hypothetical protein